jgi:transposase
MNEYSTIIGMDLGDKLSHYAVMARTETDIEATGEVRTTEPALRRVFGAMKPSLITIEAGTHSPWVSRLLTDWAFRRIGINRNR